MSILHGDFHCLKIKLLLLTLSNPT